MTMHTKGLLITIAGILVISPDSLLIRLIGMDIWSTSAYRGGLQAIGLALLLLVIYRTRLPAVFRSIGRTGLIIAVFAAVTNCAFVAGIKYTSVANALIFLATVPFHAAVMSRLFLGEVIAMRTWVAIGVGLIGVVIIVGDGLGGGGTFGDAMALMAALLLAGQLTMMRGRREINMVPAVALGGLIYCVMAIVIGGMPERPTEMQALWIVIMGLAVTTPATALLALGPRYISSPEVGLIVLLETVLGPLWVWLVIHEAPGAWTLVGGALVVLTLIVHSLVSLRDHARVRAQRAA